MLDDDHFKNTVEVIKEIKVKRKLNLRADSRNLYIKIPRYDI